MVDVAFQWVVGTVLLLVSPLYGKWLNDFRTHREVNDNTEDIADNLDAIAENSKKIDEIDDAVTRIEYEIQVVHRNMKVLHDLVAEENHCGVESCAWCEKDDED